MKEALPCTRARDDAAGDAATSGESCPASRCRRRPAARELVARLVLGQDTRRRPRARRRACHAVRRRRRRAQRAAHPRRESGLLDVQDLELLGALGHDDGDLVARLVTEDGRPTGDSLDSLCAPGRPRPSLRWRTATTSPRCMSCNVTFVPTPTTSVAMLSESMTMALRRRSSSASMRASSIGLLVLGVVVSEFSEMSPKSRGGTDALGYLIALDGREILDLSLRRWKPSGVRMILAVDH